MNKFWFVLCDNRFNVIAKDNFSSSEEAMEKYPNAEFSFGSDYCTGERRYMSLKNRFQYTIIEKDIEDIKQNGGYLAVEGPYFKMFLKKNEDGTFTKYGKKAVSTCFTFDELMDYLLEYKGEEKMYVVKASNSLKSNPVYAMLPQSDKKKLDNDGFYGGDVAFRFWGKKSA